MNSFHNKRPTQIYRKRWTWNLKKLACCLLFCAYAIVPSNFFSFSSCQSLTLSFWTNIPPLVTITTRASFDLQLVKFTILQFYSNIISWFTTLIEEVLRFVLASVFPDKFNHIKFIEHYCSGSNVKTTKTFVAKFFSNPFSSISLVFTMQPALFT